MLPGRGLTRRLMLCQEWMGVRMHSVKLGSGFSAVRGHRYRQVSRARPAQTPLSSASTEH
eukprot:1614021-Rhodomonas_salina.8